MVWQDWLILFGWIGLMALVVGLGIVWTRRQHRYIVSRVSNGSLVFQPTDGGAGRIPVAEIEEVIDVSGEGNGFAFEIVTTHGVRILLIARPVVGYFAVLKRALQRANPRIRSSVRDNRCHKCGADLRLRRDVCPQCAELIPIAVGRL
jgi:hypothetical protein